MLLVNKLVILHGVNNDLGNGVVKLQAIDNTTYGSVKIFEPNNIDMRLAIRVNFSNIVEYEIDSLITEFAIEGNFKLEDRVQCVVVNADTLMPVLVGSSDGLSVDIDKMCSNLSPLPKNSIESGISSIVGDKAINENIYKEDNADTYIFDENSKELRKDNNQAITKMIDNADGSEDYFVTIKSQLDRLFGDNPADKELMLSVPNSKWVRVYYNNDDEYYVVGVLYNGKRATHICYGVAGDFNVRPKQKAEWLPLDYSNPEGAGYWMIFQDAITGKTLY